MNDLNGLAKKLVSYRNKKVIGLAEGMRAAAEFIKEESLKIVPRQTGYLASTVFVKRVYNQSRPTFVVGFSAKYALIVHERLDLAHGKEFNVKHADKIKNAGAGHPIWFNRGVREQAKFLERPMRENRQKIREIIKSKIRS